ncbi:hypothetical protein [Rhodoferax sp. OV413]|nr:hypothetical protein [Rhodoferax sp. OV413]
MNAPPDTPEAHDALTRNSSDDNKLAKEVIAEHIGKRVPAPLRYRA